MIPRVLPVLILAFAVSISFAAPPEQDRAAILAMAGEYEVEFNFDERVALTEGYELKESYHEDASEMVVVVEDTPERIVLQHILLAGNRVVKHWKQVWTWEDTRIVEYQGNERWKVRELDAEEVKGTWSQLVTQVDDSPRYESYGEWKHDGGYSRWESGPTARPLPRREYTKRDDYQVLLGVNRHSITPKGWVHEQDNVKMVVDEEGNTVRFLAQEDGINYYDRSDATDFTRAREYWESTRDFWGTVSEFWDRVESDRDAFAIEPEVEGDSLVDRMFAIAKDIQAENKPAPDAGEVEKVIERYLN